MEQKIAKKLKIGNEEYIVGGEDLQHIANQVDNAVETAKTVARDCIQVCGYNNLPEFREDTEYLQNDLVRYNNRVWRFLVYHPAGAWVSAEAVESSLYSEIQSIRGADVEQVLVRLAVPEGDTIDWTKYFINVTIGEELPVSIYLTEQGECAFEVQKGEIYIIDFPTIDGYQLKADAQYKALVNTRTITYEYRTYSGGESVNTEIVKVFAHLYDTNFTRYQTHSAIVAAGLEALSPYGKQVILSVDDLYDEDGNMIAAGGIQYATYDENLCAAFAQPVAYGANYTVTTSDVDGTTKSGRTKKGVADYPEAYFYFSYTKIALGLELIDTTTGENIDITTLADLDDDTKAHLRANGSIRIENETLANAVIDSEGNKGAGFQIKLPITYKNKQWASANVEFSQAYLPFKTNETLAQQDFKGAQNTRYIRALGDGLEGGTGNPSVLVETPAADYCENPNWGETTARQDSGTGTCCPALYIQGRLYPSHLGAAGEWQFGAKANAGTIYAIQQNLLFDGKEGRPAAVNFASGNWWSSTQYNATHSWYLNNGRLTNNLKTNTNNNAVPFYDLHPVES